MGTRGLFGLVVDGEVKAGYNHYDSYPSGLGLGIIEQIASGGITVDAARNLVMVDEQSTPTDEQVEALAEFHDPTVSTGSAREWYSLLRGAQGDLLALLGAGFMIENESFAADSLFCEWGYLVNLDEGILEVYKGFNTSPPTGRYAGLTSAHENYKPITLVAEVPFTVEDGVATFTDEQRSSAVETMNSLEGH